MAQAVKRLPAMQEAWVQSLGQEDPLEKENCNLLQYSCLENYMDGGAWLATVLGVSKSRTRLSDFTFTFHFHALEKEMATHSTVLAWRIPGTAEPGGLPSMGSHRVGHNWSDLAAAAAMYMSIPISQFIPPPLSSLVIIKLFSTSVALFLFCK